MTKISGFVRLVRLSEIVGHEKDSRTRQSDSWTVGRVRQTSNTSPNSSNDISVIILSFDGVHKASLTSYSCDIYLCDIFSCDMYIFIHFSITPFLFKIESPSFTLKCSWTISNS